MHDEAKLRQDIAVYYGMISFMDQRSGAFWTSWMNWALPTTPL
ncbi:MAG: hypothetical protein R2911_14970 [Caldilineaceae bacterium]